jgi:hypothetical protein
MKFAIIDEQNTVVNVIVADSLEVAQQVTSLTCMEVTEEVNVSPGSIWDGVNFVYPEPKVELEVTE